MTLWDEIKQFTHLTTSGDAVAPATRCTFRTFLSNGIGWANASTSLWVTVITQMGTVTSFTGERIKKEKKIDIKYWVLCLWVSLCFCLFSFAFTVCLGVLSVLFGLYVCSVFFLLLSCSFSSILCDLWSLCAPARCCTWTSEVEDLSPGCWSLDHSQLHGIFIGNSSLRGLHLNSKTWFHSKSSKLQC